jgi:hypothetical protein
LDRTLRQQRAKREEERAAQNESSGAVPEAPSHLDCSMHIHHLTLG